MMIAGKPNRYARAALAAALIALMLVTAASCGGDADDGGLLDLGSDGSAYASPTDGSGERSPEGSDLGVNRPEVSSFTIGIPQGYLNNRTELFLGRLFDAYFEATGVRVTLNTTGSLQFTDEDSEIQRHFQTNPTDAFFSWSFSWRYNQSFYAMDIEDALKEYAPLYYASLDERYVDYARTDGALKQVPKNYPSNERLCVVVRRDLMEKYGIPPIKTLEDYENFMRIIKENEEGIYPANQTVINSNLLIRAQDFYPDWPVTFKASQKDSPLVVWFLTDEFKAMLERINYWKRMGYIYNSKDVQFDFMMRETASFVTDIYSLQGALSGLMEFMDLKAYVLYPDKEAHIGYGWGYLSVYKESTKVKEIMEFVEWVNMDQEAYDLLMYGILDKDYTLVGEKVKFLEGSQVWGPGMMPFLNVDRMRQIDGVMDDWFYDEYLGNMAESFHVGNLMMGGEFWDRFGGVYDAIYDNLWPMMDYLQETGTIDEHKVNEYLDGMRVDDLGKMLEEMTEASLALRG
ncbi:MAG: extracellular solute-binding protein [Oscillospiraceae bacterium]|nr:extracellular solute-binding protein [Oscillospiraceae bacterium]